MKQTPDVASTTHEDRMYHAWLGRKTFGLSPASMMLTYLDWALHLAIAPGKQAEILEKVRRKALRFAVFALNVLVGRDIPPVIEPLLQDRRFQDECWQQPPFNLIYQAFLLYQQLLYNATTGIRGVSRRHEQAMFFMARQVSDVFSPSNFLWTNPKVLQATITEGGHNLVRGLVHFVEDQERTISGKKPVGAERFKVGETVAATPGKVVYRNRLIELIQYSPSTDTVWREPILMVPSWVMKYYVMDLSPENSMVKYLVDGGHSVFMISWKNPDSEDRDLDFGDYRRIGVMDALNAVCNIIPDTKVHTIGYGLGGILLTISAATMGRDHDARLASVTLLTTLTDFSELGDMAVFIEPSQVSFLEDLMWQRGYLDPKEIAWTFQALRSRDLIWSKMVHEYLLGKRKPMFDVVAWNADGTRVPYLIQSQLLRKLFLNNDLWDGRFQTTGRPIVIGDIQVPIFAVGALDDFVAPWQSVYKLHLRTETNEVTFVLTSGGHNVGIVNPPGPEARGYQMATSKAGDRYIPPEMWTMFAPKYEGSWWPAWEQWLSKRSTKEVPAPPTGNPEKGLFPLTTAPGTYVVKEWAGET
jgi:polyhydroxyalkanoate synthase